MPDANTTERTPEPAARKSGRPRLVRAAGVAGLLVPVAWAAIVALELSQGQVSHSLVSRPERLFGALDSRWFAVLLAAGVALLVLQLLLVGGVLLRAERRRVARVAFAVAAVAAAARYGVSLLARTLTSTE